MISQKVIDFDFDFSVYEKMRLCKTDRDVDNLLDTMANEAIYSVEDISEQERMSMLDTIRSVRIQVEKWR